MFRNSMQWLGVAFLSVAALVVASGAATAQSYVYSLTDLTYGITSDCHPTGFNNSGWAVGNYYGNPDGFFSSVATGFVDLSGLSAANGINNSGVIAGTTPDGYAATCVVANGAGTVTTLGPGSANDINDFNQVVGTGPTLSNGDSHAYLYSGGVATDLGVLYGTTSDWASSWATAINNNGVIVGASMAGANYNGTLWNSHAFVYSSGTMTDLGVLPTSPADSSSYATAINMPDTSSGAVKLKACIATSTPCSGIPTARFTISATSPAATTAAMPTASTTATRLWATRITATVSRPASFTITARCST